MPCKTKPWINEALQDRNLWSRKVAVAQGLSRYSKHEDMPYLNLVEDSERRVKYNSLPTATFNNIEVDALTVSGGELLKQSEPFQQFLDGVARLTNRSAKTGIQP